MDLLPIEGVTRCPCGAKYWDADICASCGERYSPAPPQPTHYLERLREFGWELMDEAYTDQQPVVMQARYTLLDPRFTSRTRRIA